MCVKKIIQITFNDDDNNNNNIISHWHFKNKTKREQTLAFSVMTKW